MKLDRQFVSTGKEHRAPSRFSGTNDILLRIIKEKDVRPRQAKLYGHGILDLPVRLRAAELVGEIAVLRNNGHQIREMPLQAQTDQGAIVR